MRTAYRKFTAANINDLGAGGAFVFATNTACRLRHLLLLFVSTIPLMAFNGTVSNPA